MANKEKRLLWAELTAEEVSQRAKEEAIVILPIASTEQHGPHLPTGVDTILCSAIALATAEKLRAESIPVLVAPCLWVGLAGHHMSLGGTFTLSEATYRAVLGDLVRSAAHHGFDKIVLLNGHGGNINASTAAAVGLTEELDLAVVAATYWLAAPHVFAEKLEAQPTVQHACEAETSMMMAVTPALVRVDRIDDAVPKSGPVFLGDPPGLVHHRPFAWRTPTGVLGDPRAASKEKGEDLIEATSAVLAGEFAKPSLWER